MDDYVGCENPDEEIVAMIEESPSGDEAVQDAPRSWFMWFFIFNYVFNLFYLVKIDKLVFKI